MSKLAYNSIDEIKTAHETIKRTFLSGKTRPIAWRKQQLKALGFLIQDNEEAFVAALKEDLDRPRQETYVNEIEPIKAEIMEAYNNVEKWAKPVAVTTTWVWMAAKPTLYSEPKGIALVISTWNFPIMLSLGPLVGAIAAGCPAILKLAEQTPAVSALFARLFPKYLDSSAYIIINGAVDETTALLKLRYDHIFYTGNGTVGRIIAHAAADHLTPVTLELGGKSPAVVFDDANMDVAAKRIASGKYMNAGQICIAPDYVLATASAKAKLIPALERAVKSFTEGTSKKMHEGEAEYCRTINSRHFERLVKLMDDTKGTIVVGGGRNASANKVEVTVIDNVKADDPLMQDEIFGPLLPIVEVQSKDEVVSFIQERDNPLALYVFTSNKANRDYVFERTRSGGFLQNDFGMQYVVPGLPFGGAGPSGYGNYKGKRSFDTFSHERSSASIPTWLEPVYKSRYPPYTPEKLKSLLLLTKTVIKGPRTFSDKVKTLLKVLSVTVAIVVGYRYRFNKI